MKRILLAIDDSPAGLGAARAAVALAAETGAQVRAIHVLTDGEVTRALGEAPDRSEVDDRRGRASAAVLAYVAGLADRAGVAVETVALVGRPAKAILHEATAWQADLVVVGRAGDGHVGLPYVGSDVRHVLEFAEIPVLVVPAPDRT